MLEEWKIRYAPKTPEEEWKAEFIEACQQIEKINYYLDLLVFGELQDRIEFLLDSGKDVKRIEERMEEYRRNNKEQTGRSIGSEEMNSEPYSQEWFEDGQIDEVAFCENFLQRMPLKCINGIFFSYDGMLPDSEVEKEIYRMVKPVLTKGISKKVKQLLEVLKLEAYSEELPVQMDRIHVNNGTYFLNGDFTENKEFCLNRLPVNYEMKETKPERWMKFLSELLEEDDIPTLQEYMGYCLIPSNKAQKLLIILGKAGRKIPYWSGHEKNSRNEYECKQYSKGRA